MNKIRLLTGISFFFSLSILAQNPTTAVKSKDSIIKSPFSKQQKSSSYQLPYPIVFIHGLNSSSETWNTTTNYLDSQYNFIFGGRFDFCLNADNNNATTNTNFYPLPNADIRAFETSVIPNGDYYYINFNVNPDGTIGSDALSNQAAITKQGKALQKAIERILTLTEKNKVILVGHSMGGLAAREYIQNSYNYQADGQHHVAKLLTIGTPHGGSNASDSGLGWFAGIDTHSEAIRDLKTTYYYSGDQGRFLFGGVEINDNLNMNEHLIGSDFFNYDVNCNGSIGDNIIGLNQKTIDNLIDFSSIIGRITNGTTDGVVDEPSSNLNHFYPTLTYPAKLFYYTSASNFIQNHTELPGYYYEIMQGLDEPNFKELAFKISPNNSYIGFSTVQSNTTENDNDYFSFTIAENSNTIINISSIVNNQMEASIIDQNETTIGNTHFNNGNSINFNTLLSPGNYYLKLSSTTPSNTDYLTPYIFSISTTLDTNSNLFSNFNYYPNPIIDNLALENISLSRVKIYNTVGQIIENINLDTNKTYNTINLSHLKSGIYLMILENENTEKTIKIIKQ